MNERSDAIFEAYKQSVVGRHKGGNSGEALRTHLRITKRSLEPVMEEAARRPILEKSKRKEGSSPKKSPRKGEKKKKPRSRSLNELV